MDNPPKMDSSSPPDNGKRESLQMAGKQPLDLIDVVNDLQNKLALGGHTLDIALPQIVVVGCQSAGKSSVLESFVGREFLPRGSDVVTRRPTVVQLHPSTGEEYGIFLHKEKEKFTDFAKIKKEILDETNRKPGPIGFSPDPISLKIFSPKVLKLTVVDLPGLIRNAVTGQPEDSMQIVREMVLSYIRQPQTLILAVSPANQDIANSDALNIARIADPDRERTIGVLTKLDLMDEGTNAREVLENKKIPLKRGYVGVLNRSQKDIDAGRDIQYILRKEKEFFTSRDCYRHIAHRMGTLNLQILLQKMLRSHIKVCLPNVRTDISQKLSAYKKELKEFEKVLGNVPNGKQFYLIKLIQNFIDDLNVKMMGYSEGINMRVLTAGAQIHFILYTRVQEKLELSLIPDEEELTILVANLCGVRNSISVPSLALDAMNGKLLEFYKEPLEESVNCVMDVLITAVEESAKLLDSYPTLKNEVLFRICSFIKQETEKTQNRLKEHIDAEMFYSNIAHPDFKSEDYDTTVPSVGLMKVWNSEDTVDDTAFYDAKQGEVKADDAEIPPKSTTEEGDSEASDSNKDDIVQLLKNLKASPRFQHDVAYVKGLIMKYLKIIHKQVGDTTIKYIAYFLIHKVMEFTRKDLIPTLVESANIASLTEDCDEDFQRKERVESTCAYLELALEAIQSF
ncbi:dynamin-1-like [Uloborus diversus]|uniref:dynamin-1-like n=1 Tax=Uloborus diversus TaxID=327109 RepID=UPI002409F79A|nr:dynamin-1-like [Uloborus diversus]